MKVLRTIIENYEKEFKNAYSENIVIGFNEKQSEAFNIVKNNTHLEDSVLNQKLAKTLYSVKPDHSSYKRFREYFKKKIFRIVLVHNGKGSKLQNIGIELIEELAVYNKLMVMGLKTATSKNVKRSLDRALKYHFFEIARSLSYIYLRIQKLDGSIDSIFEAKTTFENIDTICKNEEISNTAYHELISIEEIEQETKSQYLELLDKLKKRMRYDSCSFHYFYFSVLLLLSDDNEYEALCNKALDYFNNLWFDHAAYIAIFRRRLLEYKLRQGEFTNAVLVLDLWMKELKPTSYQWYIYALTYVQALLYDKQYETASKWYSKVVQSRNFRNQPKDHRNEWEVLGMYVHLMNDTTDKIKIHKVKYNLDYGKTDRSSTNKKFLVAELFYHLKKGNPHTEDMIKHLQDISKEDNRTQALCHYLSNGAIKFEGTELAVFEQEPVTYEDLIRIF